MPGYEDFERRLSTMSVRERGSAFEASVKRFLETESCYRDEVKRVWFWSEWPLRWGADAGIDLVVETNDGEEWAVQCKAWANGSTLKKAEIDSFLAEATGRFSHRILFATTDGLSGHARRVLRDHGAETRLRGSLLDSDFDWSFRTMPIKAKPLVMRQHQKQAVRRLRAGFGHRPRQQLILPCGTGKTLVALRVAESRGWERVVYAAPSLAILQQTIKSWRRNRTKRFFGVAVCSDLTVGGDEWAAPEDLPIRTLRDSAAVGDFLSGPGRRYVFTTYQSLDIVAEALIARALSADLVVADEAHRTVAPQFSSVVDEKKVPAKRRLFMTATPRVLAERHRSRSEFLSMDDESAYGPVAFRMSFREAIDNDLLSDYEVLVVAAHPGRAAHAAAEGWMTPLTGSTVSPARHLATSEAVLTTASKREWRRIISFHSSVASSKSFSAAVERLGDTASFSSIGTPWALSVDGTMTTKLRTDRLKKLIESDDDLGVITNARCLTEGVDVPALDAVVFADPRTSQIDIVQAVGRAIRKSPGKKIGNVVVPIVIDEESWTDITNWSGAYDAVWRTLRALRSHDEDLAEELDEIRADIGSGGRPRLPGKVHLIGFDDIPAEAFRGDFVLRAVEESSSEWNAWFGRLTQYVTETGSARMKVTEVFTDKAGKTWSLGRWVEKQRSAYRSGHLLPERSKQLSDLPEWVWHYDDADWQERYEVLKEFSGAHGHVMVPRHIQVREMRLQTWVSKQRQKWRSHDLEPSRIQALEAIPEWSWTPQDDRFLRSARALADYIRRTGRPSTPEGETQDGVDVHKWSENVRQRRRACQRGGKDLPKHYLEALVPAQELGWSWTPRKDADPFVEKASALEQVAASRPSGLEGLRLRDVVDGVPVGRFINTLRSRRDGLTLEQQRRLEGIRGWLWTPQDDVFNANLDELRSFGRDHGHLRISPKENKRLATFKRNNKNKLKDSRSPRAEEFWSILREFGEDRTTPSFHSDESSE